MFLSVIGGRREEVGKTVGKKGGGIGAPTEEEGNGELI